MEDHYKSSLNHVSCNSCDKWFDGPSQRHDVSRLVEFLEDELARRMTSIARKEPTYREVLQRLRPSSSSRRDPRKSSVSIFQPPVMYGVQRGIERPGCA